MEKESRFRVARRVTDKYECLILDLQNAIVAVKTYANADFVSILLQKKHYLRFEKIVKRINIPTKKVLNNALLTILDDLEIVSSKTQMIGVSHEQYNQ